MEKTKKVKKVKEEMPIVSIGLCKRTADDLLPMQSIYLSDDGESDEWTVLDIGEPFILIENKRTHFASLYRVVDCVYVEDLKVN